MGKFVEVIRFHNVNHLGYFEYSFVEMTFVVGQGEISLLGRYRGWKVSGQGLISPRQMQPSWSTRVELKFCFVFSEVK